MLHNTYSDVHQSDIHLSKFFDIFIIILRMVYRIL